MSLRFAFAVLFLGAACGSSDSAPPPDVTCDAWKTCGPDSGLSVNELLCRGYIDEPDCGAAYKAWVRCYTDGCANGAEGGSDDRCLTERGAWMSCRSNQNFDAGRD